MKSRATLKLTSASSKRHAHLAQGLAHVGLGDFAQAAQVAERVLKFLA
jgi:sulfur relay (sulfurtransferase) complex TusBCD TusD component (DsrE family)